MLSCPPGLLNGRELRRKEAATAPQFQRGTNTLMQVPSLSFIILKRIKEGPEVCTVTSSLSDSDTIEFENHMFLHGSHASHLLKLILRVLKQVVIPQPFL